MFNARARAYTFKLCLWRISLNIIRNETCACVRAYTRTCMRVLQENKFHHSNMRQRRRQRQRRQRYDDCLLCVCVCLLLAGTTWILCYVLAAPSAIHCTTNHVRMATGINTNRNTRTTSTTRPKCRLHTTPSAVCTLGTIPCISYVRVSAFLKRPLRLLSAKFTHGNGKWERA